MVNHSTKCEVNMDMDKILDQVLMPPPALSPRTSVESLRNPSSHSLDRSNNSSAGSSTNSSWLSDSSCSCHSVSPQSQNTKSLFVFHKQPILPPLLCSASRTEMRVYRTKALEKEQKKKEKNKQRLISRVEAILSSVDFSPVKKHHLKNTCDGKEEISVEDSEDDSDSNENVDEVTEESTEDDVKSNHDNTDDVTNLHEQTDDITDHHDNQKEATDFQDEAYRSSLRNLLQKSLDNSDLLTPGKTPQSPKMTDTDEHLVSEGIMTQQSSSESEGDMTENTVVDLKTHLHEMNKNTIKSDQSSPNSPENSIYSSSCGEEDKVVDSLVHLVLKDAKDELTKQKNVSLFSPYNTSCDITEAENENDVSVSNENNCENSEISLKNTIICPEKLENVSIWKTPNVAKNNRDNESPLEVPATHSNDLHNQSTSTKIGFPLDTTEMGVNEGLVEVPSPLNEEPNELDQSPIPIDKELNDKIENTLTSEIVELEGAICYESTIAESCNVPMATDSKSADSLAESDSAIDELTMLRPASSNTLSDVTMTTETKQLVTTYKKQLENEETSQSEASSDTPAMETGSLVSLKRSSSFTLDQPSKSFESAVIEAVSQHFQGLQNQFNADPEKLDGKPTKDSEIAAAKKKRMLMARVRRGSYTLDEPSPYLVKNKDGHTICVESPNIDVCSETTEGSVRDVKRKLDLPSDSEESSVTSEVKRRSQNKTKKAVERKAYKIASKVANTPDTNVAEVSQDEPTVVDWANSDVTNSNKDEPNSSETKPKVAELCQILQDQHKLQMEDLKRKHQEQIVTIQQELAHSQTNMSRPLDSARYNEKVLLPPIEITISPSRASTEYHDICIRREVYEEYSVKSVQHEQDVSRISDVQVTPSLHDAMCKFSALCKGHLTRRLLQSNKVQDIMQVIRDTSRLILSLRTEGDHETQDMDAIRDTYLEDRAFNQLRSALYQFHDIFFNIPSSERMYLIAQTAVLEGKVAEKRLAKTHKLSLATQKSLERKKMLSSNEAPSRPNSSHGKPHSKEVKSKISYIWKTEPTTIPQRKPSTEDTTSSKVTSQSKKGASQKSKVMSQTSITTSQSSIVSKSPSSSISLPSKSSKILPKSKIAEKRSPSGRMTSHLPKMTSQNGKVTSQKGKVTSQGSKMKSQSNISVAKKPLGNRINTGNSKVTRAK